MSSMKEQRVDFIDLAKGICILLVILGHVGYNINLPGLNAMRMPLYFVLSGLFFKNYGGFIFFIQKKFNRLLIPFLFFYLVSYLLYYCFDLLYPGLITTDATGIMDVFTQRQYFNGPIWFLLCLFWVNILFYLISLKKSEWIRAILVFFIGGIGILLGKHNIFLPCVLDISMTALPFFYFGFILRKTPILYPNKLDRFNLLFAVCLYGVVIFLGGLFQYPTIGFHYNSISGNIVVIFILALASVLAVLLLCKRIKYLPFVSYFGRYSIIPLCVHHLIYRPVHLFFDRIGVNEYGVFLTGIITILICWACIPICIKVIPYFTAQKDLISIANDSPQ